MNRLYRDDGRYTEDAQTLDDEVFEVLKPIMKKWDKNGYPVREISHVIQAAVSMLESEIVLIKGAEEAKRRREERESKKK